RRSDATDAATPIGPGDGFVPERAQRAGPNPHPCPIGVSKWVGAIMRDDQHRFLSLLGGLPARLTTEQAAWVLNCQAHDVPILVASRLLKPLGSPQPNSVKYFATIEILELVKDRAWLARMTNAVSQHWREKNRKKNGAAGGAAAEAAEV